MTTTTVDPATPIEVAAGGAANQYRPPRPDASMRIAVVGKGGSGKTTTSAILARSLARRGVSVIALDCDTNPNLGISLGVGFDETDRLPAMRQALDDEQVEHAPTWDELISRFGTDAPDGVRMAIVNRIENPEPG